MHANYTVFKRENGFYYYYYYNNDGKRMKGSTGEKSKVKALLYLQNLDLTKENKKKIIFFDYFSSWFKKETCPYYKDSKRNGHVLSTSYLRNGRICLDKYLLPYWGNFELNRIKTYQIEEWKFYLLEKTKLSNKSVYTYLSFLGAMLGYAYRHDVIDTNPFDKVKKPAKNSKQRGILTKEEATAVFNKPWSNQKAYYANYLAMLTGMRAGEILALKKSDFKDDYILVQHSYDEVAKQIKCTKTGTVRAVPIPRSLGLVLKSFELFEDAFLFSKDGVTPLNSSTCLLNLRRALIQIGISEEQQEERCICFHSWRHYLNSQLRLNGVSDIVTKKITGHTTDEMMEHYTHISQDDISVITKVQKLLIV